MKAICITTPRLLLRPRTLTEMAALYCAETDREMKQVYTDMLRAMAELPGREEWGADWRISLPSGETVGDICFKGAPDARGTVELGYGIEPAYQGRGYATEAVEAMCAFALAQPGVTAVRAETLAENALSQRVLQKNGFLRCGDGKEGPLFEKRKQE